MDGTEDDFIYKSDDENSSYTEFNFYDEEAMKRDFKLFGDWYIVGSSKFEEYFMFHNSFYLFSISLKMRSLQRKILEIFKGQLIHGSRILPLFCHFKHGGQLICEFIWHFNTLEYA